MADSSAAPRRERESALLIAIAEAEPVVGDLRLAHDAVAAHGIPAHVTVLYPFIPPHRLTDEVRSAISEVFGAMPAFDYRFDRVARFGTTTVYLAPERASEFSRLTAAAQGRWPEHPPYGGVFEVVIPHLTIGDELEGSTADALEAAALSALARHGPIVGRATHVALMTSDTDGRWSLDSRHALAERR